MPKPPRPLAPQSPPPRQRARVALVVAFAAVVLGILILPLVANPLPPVEPRPLSEVLTAIERGSHKGHALRHADLDDDHRLVVLTLAGGKQLSASYPADFGPDLVGRLEKARVRFDAEPPAQPSPLGSLLIGILPVVLIVGAMVVLMRRGGMGGVGAKAFATTKAEVADVPPTRFTDVVGCDEAVDELSEVVSFLHDPAPFQAAGANMPRGFLLIGPPGTGKTLLARAVAGEAGVPFYSVAGSDFAEMFVGVGAARVRDLFAKAKKSGGIVFLDEIDSVGRARVGQGPTGGTEERESTLNALLVEMDGFGSQDNVIVMAATNRPDVLDPALLRAGRFDRQVAVAPPDRRGRTLLLELYARGRQIAPEVDFVALARRTPSLTGADIANFVNQAALEAARHQREILSPGDFDEALATVVMGRARKSAVVTERDREVTAWHEAGHTVAALVLPEAHDPVQVTIVPRGPAGGVTWMGGDDHSFLTRSQARAQLAVAMAGRAAEELLLDGDCTQGASGDLASATSLATKMVTAWGMSSIGLAAVSTDPFGRLGERVHAEVDAMLGQGLDEARSVLAANRRFFDAVVAELLAEDTADLDRLLALRADVEASEEQVA